MKTLAASDAVDEDNESEKQESDNGEGVAPLKVNATSFRKLLAPIADIGGDGDNDADATLGERLRKNFQG